jgi:hypothetical protein
MTNSCRDCAANANNRGSKYIGCSEYIRDVLNLPDFNCVIMSPPNRKILKNATNHMIEVLRKWK